MLKKNTLNMVKTKYMNANIFSEFNKVLRSSLMIRFGISSLDQAILSTANFLLAMFLIKVATKEEYGYYALALPITLFITSIQNALINTPYLVLSPDKDEKEKKEYLSSVIYSQIFSSVLIFAIILLLGIILTLVKLISVWAFLMIVSVTIASIGLLSREFLRTYFFSNETPKLALKNDFLYFIILFVLIILYFLSFKISIQFIFLFIGASAFLSSFYKIKPLLTHTDRRLVKLHLLENWLHGKWILIGVIVTYIQSYAYLYLLGIMVSVSATAEVSAAKLLITPFSLLSVGYAKVAVPRGAQLKIQNKLKLFYKEEIFISAIFSVLVLLYTVVVLGIPDHLKNLILSNKYHDSYEYFIFFSISIFFGFFMQTGSNGLQVLKKFKILSKINFLSMLIVVPSTYILITLLGIRGGLIALILGQIFSSIFMWTLFTKEKKLFK